MPCYHPIELWKYLHGPNRGEVTLKRPWRASQDWDGHNHFFVPCGKCVGCRLKRSREWAVRIMHERRYHDEACFITLTYDPEHLPPDGSLQKKDLQDFWKRLRSKVGKLRYFACGEYGTNLGRPHYHAAVFGWTPPDVVACGFGGNGDRIYSSAFLDLVWTHGKTVVGELSFASAAYVARYVTKKVYGDDAESHYDGKVPEFLVMSRRPGIGETFVSDYGRQLLDNDFVVIDNQQFILPRYYDKKIALQDERKFASIHAERVRKALAVPRDSPARMAQRELYRTLKSKLLERGFENGTNFNC